MTNHPFATRPKPEECECCTNPPFTFFRDMWICKDCFEKDNQIKAMIQPVKTITPILVKTDIFNAITESIEEMRKTIEADSSIENKHYALAERLQTKINDYKKVVFDLNEQLVNNQNQLRGTQEYLNTLAVRLRSEEREKLRLMDAAYNPKPLTKPSKTVPKKVTTKPKFDKNELRKYAKELNCAEYTLQAIVTARNCSVEEAANYLRRTVKEGQSESEN